MNLASGTLLGRYKVREKIGAGGMGEVYLAQDTGELERAVAVKLLSAEVASDPRRMQRFVQEARTVSGLTHPNILTVYDFGETGATRFVVTEYVDGVTLRQYMASRRLKLHDVLDITAQVAAALDAAHEAGVVHRDIKPENVMIRRRDHIVKVLDFGLAKLAGKPAAVGRQEVDTQAGTQLQVNTEPGLVLGTVAYMSPEQTRGEAVDARADIWSLGVVLYEMVAGRLPFEGKDAYRQIIAIQDEEPPPLARFAEGVPERLEEITQKALAKDPNERFQSAKDLLIDIQRLKRKLEVDAEIDRTAPPEQRGAGVEAKTSGVREAVPDAQASAAQTAPVEGARTASSAEYVFAGIRRHKRGVAVALVLLLLASAAVVAYRFTNRTDSIAVLPFANVGGDPNTEYLSDGIPEALINSLTELQRLRVVARSTAFRYKGREADPQQVGRELNVRTVLTGRVRQVGDTLNVQVDLVDAQTGAQLWGEEYERKVSDVLAVKQEIAREITGKLRLRLSGEEQKQLVRHDTANAEGYEFYLKGRYYLYKRTPDDFRKAVGYFQQAIEKDPNYASAYAGLADSYNAFGGYGLIPGTESAPKATEAATKAVELDDTLSEAHTSLGLLKLYYSWNRQAAQSEFRRAIELNPSYASAHYGYAYCLITLGRTAESIAEIKRAQELDPLSLPIAADAGEIYYFARRPDEAVAQLRKAIDMDPNFARAHFLLGRALEQEGDFPAAIAEFKAAVALSPDNNEMLAALGQGYAAWGKREEALKVLSELQQRAGQGYVSPHLMAIIYASLGDKDQAFAWLGQAVEKRFPPLIYLNVNPIWDNLHSDPRFSDLLRRMNLSP